MTGLLRTAMAFLVRDVRTEISYRFAFLLQFTGLFVNTLLWFFMARFIAAGNETLLEQTKGLEYFPWALGGLMANRFLDVSLSAYAMQIRTEQTTGTLEAMLVTPARLGNIVLASATWSYLFAALQAAMFLVFGVFVFGVELDVGSVPGALLAIVGTIVSISGIGILSAAFVLYFKRGNPINFLISTTSFLFGNVVIPAAALPPALRWISDFMPLTYATEAVRGALFRGQSFAELAPNLVALAAFAVVLVPIGLVGARIAVHRAKREGTLVQY